MKRGMTVAAFQSLGILDNTKERFNRLLIGVATMAADSFRKRVSRLSSPADWYGSRFCSSFRTSAVWIWGGAVTVLPSLIAVGSWEEVLLFT